MKVLDHGVEPSEGDVLLPVLKKMKVMRWDLVGFQPFDRRPSRFRQTGRGEMQDELVTQRLQVVLHPLEGLEQPQVLRLGE